ncbi:MAG: diguanylate cyclase [Candidatus Diapherotrites archaeon]|nr:diguanylate cyclase [Candidatus Diapherotrites archaeon]
MAKQLKPKLFVLRRSGQPPVIESPIALERSVSKLHAAAKRMRSAELLKLQRMVKRGASRKYISAQIARIRSLDKKVAALIDPRLEKVKWVMRRDPEFHSLLDRTFFFGRLREVLLHSGPHSLVYIDMDHLKKINNGFGRKKGGFAVLDAFANALSMAVAEGANVRSKASAKLGFAGHIGGDEFLLYLHMQPSMAQAFLRNQFEQLRMQQLKRWPLYKKAVAARLPLTYSAGIIGLKKGADPARAENAADRLCFMAKRIGKKQNTFSIRPDLDAFRAELASKAKMREKRRR